MRRTRTMAYLQNTCAKGKLLQHVNMDDDQKQCHVSRLMLVTDVSFVIDNFEEEMTIWKSGEELESNPFLLSGKTFLISVFPNGYDDNSKACVSIYLKNLASEDITVCSEITAAGLVTRKLGYHSGVLGRFTSSLCSLEFAPKLFDLDISNLQLTDANMSICDANM